MQIKCKYLRTTSLINKLSVWSLQIDRVKLIGRNLDELNECCSWVEVENKKNNDSLSRPSYPMNLQCL